MAPLAPPPPPPPPPCIGTPGAPCHEIEWQARMQIWLSQASAVSYIHHLPGGQRASGTSACKDSVQLSTAVSLEGQCGLSVCGIQTEGHKICDQICHQVGASVQGPSRSVQKLLTSTVGKRLFCSGNLPPSHAAYGEFVS